MTTAHASIEPAASHQGSGGLARFRLDLAYDGTEFSGWAIQPALRTVQETVETALSTVLRRSPAPRLIVAGRTDAGVHATGQVAHVDIDADVDPVDLQRRLTGVLPSDLVVNRVAVAAPGFDARFSALGRLYRYRLADQRVNPLRRHDTTTWKRPLDVARMQAAGAALVGLHDFTAYCKAREGATTIRTVQEITVTRRSTGVVVVQVAADAFCHNQVRSMVGALLTVGDRRRRVSWPGEVLAAGVRNPLVVVAPARGLTLIEVRYPPDDQLADRARTTRARRDGSGSFTGSSPV